MNSRFLLVLAVAACGDDTSPGQDASAIPDAIEIDASPTCGCTFGAVGTAGMITSAEATELSGLAASRLHTDTLWTHNDSGDTARLFAFGTDGTTRGALSITGATANDWEDMAIAPCASGWCLYAADIGDNPATRPNVRIYEIDEPTTISGAMTATARTFEVAYPDGAHNSEALFVDPRDNAVYIITKQTPPSTGPSKVFRMPTSAGVATAIEVGTLTIPTGNQLVTGADFFADQCGSRLLVRTYTHVFEMSGPPNGSSIGELLSGPITSRPVASETQGEAIAWLADGRGYVTVGEGANPRISRVSCE